MGFQFRPDPTDSRWGALPWSPDQVSTEGLVLVTPNPVLNIFLSGSKQSYAEVSYIARIDAIEAKTTAMLQARKVLEDNLTAKAQEGKRFSF